MPFTCVTSYTPSTTNTTSSSSSSSGSPILNKLPMLPLSKGKCYSPKEGGKVKCGLITTVACQLENCYCL